VPPIRLPPAAQLAVEPREHRRPALVALNAEHDLAVAQVTDALEGLKPHVETCGTSSSTCAA
jgi:hypothetical protein